MLEIIKEKLVLDFNPQEIEVIDESFKHIGHAGASPDGNTHFRIKIISDKFSNLPRVKQHQLIYKCLDELIGSPIHALAIEAKAP